EEFVAERRVDEVVEYDRVVYLRGTRDDFRVRIALLTVDFVRGEVGEVDLALIEGEESGRRVLELPSDDLVEDRLATPVAVVPAQLHELAIHVVGDLEGARADRLAWGGPVRAFGDLVDRNRAKGFLLNDPYDRERIQHGGIRRVRGDRHRLRIRRGYASQGCAVAALHVRGARDVADTAAIDAAHARAFAQGQSEDDIIGGERRSVLPCHVGLEMEGPGEPVSGRRPVRGERGHSRSIAARRLIDAVCDKRLVDLAEEVLVPARDQWVGVGDADTTRANPRARKRATGG